jgi:hypothetical protein
MSREITETRSPSCEVCRDLNGDHFKHKEEDNGNSTSGGIQFHYVEFNELRDSASKSCRLCRILQQGISFFWGEDPARLPETSKGLSKDEEKSDVKERPEDELKSGEEMQLGDAKGSRKVMEIEIRPEQSLLVTRISDAYAKGHLYSGMRAPLEFYTKPGMYYTNQ